MRLGFSIYCLACVAAAAFLSGCKRNPRDPLSPDQKGAINNGYEIGENNVCYTATSAMTRLHAVPGARIVVSQKES